MSKQQQQKHGGTRKYGRDKIKCALYKSSKRREHNKLKRVLQSNGLAAAQKYAATHGLKEPQRKRGR